MLKKRFPTRRSHSEVDLTLIQSLRRVCRGWLGGMSALL